MVATEGGMEENGGWVFVVEIVSRHDTIFSNWNPVKNAGPTGDFQV